MNPILPAVLSLAIFAPLASGRLFDTPEDLVQRLDGKGFQNEGPGYFPFETIKRGTIGQIPIEAYFFKGKCLQIIYQPPASDSILQLILDKNKGASSWTKQSDQSWTRADSAAFARYADGRLWIVSTELGPDWEAAQQGRYSEALIKAALEKL